MHIASDDLKTCHGTDRGTRPRLQTQPLSLATDEYRLCLSVICICLGNAVKRNGDQKYSSCWHGFCLNLGSLVQIYALCLYAFFAALKTCTSASLMFKTGIYNIISHNIQHENLSAVMFICTVITSMWNVNDNTKHKVKSTSTRGLFFFNADPEDGAAQLHFSSSHAFENDFTRRTMHPKPHHVEKTTVLQDWFQILYPCCSKIPEQVTKSLPALGVLHYTHLWRGVG